MVWLCALGNPVLGSVLHLQPDWSLSLSLSLSLVWDGMELKLTFRRNFSEEMMNRWFELTEIVSSVVYNNDGNALVRQYDSKWEYSTQSLYAIINFRGVVPVFTPSVWKI